jgi:hypothetical protein
MAENQHSMGSGPGQTGSGWLCAGNLGLAVAMPDDLYARDALAWSERQAALVRRVARGEPVNDVDRTMLSRRSRTWACHNQHGAVVPSANACASLEVSWLAGQTANVTKSQRFRVPSLASRHRCGRGLICQGPMSLHNGQITPVRRGNDAAVPAPASPVTIDQLLTGSVEDLEKAFTSQPAG